MYVVCVALTIENNKGSELHATRVLRIDASHMSLCNLCCAVSSMNCLPSFVVNVLHVQDGLSQGTAETQGKASLSGVGLGKAYQGKLQARAKQVERIIQLKQGKAEQMKQVDQRESSQS